MLAVTPHLSELASDERFFQRRGSDGEDALVEHAHCSNALMQRVRGEVAAIQLDLRQLGHDPEVYDAPMARVPDADVDQLDRSIRAVLDAQAKKWGAPLLNHLIYARRPSIFKGARMMWSGLDASGLIDPRLVAMINRRVAFLNGCEF
jgi:hypothetical protein